jgi:hypothetical protein
MSDLVRAQKEDYPLILANAVNLPGAFARAPLPAAPSNVTFTKGWFVTGGSLR